MSGIAEIQQLAAKDPLGTTYAVLLAVTLDLSVAIMSLPDSVQVGGLVCTHTQWSQPS